MSLNYFRTTPIRFIAILSSLGIALSNTSQLSAADETWSGAIDGVWTTLGNWVSGTGTPGAGDIATFDSAGGAATTITFGATNALSIDQIILNDAAVPGYTFGAAGVDTLTFTDNANDANFTMTNDVVADQIIAADILLGPDASATDTSFDLESTTNKLIINGNIDTASGGSAGIKRLEFGDFNFNNISTVDINGNISNTGGATRIDFFAAGAHINLNGAVAADGGNTMRTYILNDGSITVGPTGVLGQGLMDVRQGTLNLNNTTTAQLFENNLNLGSVDNAPSGNATVNIAAGGTVALSSNVQYIDSSTFANTASISGGSLQITNNGRAFIVHNNSLIAETSAELTISSDITNDGSNRAITIRGANSEAEGGTIILSGNNSHGGTTTVQSGRLILGSSTALTTGGGNLSIASRNNADFAANAVATVDLNGFTNTVNNIVLGNSATSNDQGGGFQASLIDSVGGGKLVDANLITYNAGSAGKLNAGALISADIEFDTTGNPKVITIGDGADTTDLTISSTLSVVNTAHDITIIGEGTLSFTGSIDNSVDRLEMQNRKTVLSAGADFAPNDLLLVRQRNNASLSDFEIELDINGATVNLNDDLVVSQFTSDAVASVQSTRVTDTAGTGVINLNESVAQITYNTGSVGKENVSAYIAANIHFNGGNRTVNVNDGAAANVFDLEISGTITDDGGGSRNLTKNGAGTLRLTSAANAYNVLTVNNGTVQVTDVGALGDNDIALGTNTTNGVLEFLLTSDQTVAGGNQIRIGDDNAAAGRTGAGSILSNGTGAVTFGMTNFNELRNTATENRTLILGGSNTGDNTISGSIRDNGTGGSIVSLTKQDAGKWILNGNNTYTGSTTVSDGQLDINGTNSSNFTVAGGATLGGEGSTTGSLTLADGAIISGVDGSTAAALSTSEGTTGLDLSGVTAGGITVNITTAGSGDFIVLDYGGVGTGFVTGSGETLFTIGTAPTASARGALGFDDNGTAITYNLGFVENTWVGDAASGDKSHWDIGTTENWSNASPDSVFQQGDSVVFDDTGVTKGVNVTAAPEVSTFSLNTTSGNNYTFDAPTPTSLTVSDALNFDNVGASAEFEANVVIEGTGSLNKGAGAGNSTGSVILNGSHSFTGGTFIREGTIEIFDNDSLSSGLITFDRLDSQPNLILRTVGMDVDNEILYTNASSAKRILFNPSSGSGTATLSGLITNEETADWAGYFAATSGNTLEITGQITGAGGVRNNNSGTLRLTNASNDFALRLRADGGGTVEVDSIADSGIASAAGAGNSIVLGQANTDGTFSYIGTTAASTDRQVTVGASGNTTDTLYTGSAIVENNGTGTLTFTNATFNAQDTSNNTRVGARTLTLGGTNTGANEIMGVIRDNGGTASGNGPVPNNAISLIKEDAGNWILSGNNTYTGTTTVNAGTLIVNGNNTAATGTTTVNGGTLGGGSSVATFGGNVNIGGSGNHTAGTFGTGTSTDAAVQTIAGDLTYAAGATLTWDLLSNSFGDTPGGEFDQFAVTGNLSFDTSLSFDIDFGTGVDFSSTDWNANLQEWLVWDTGAPEAGTLTGLTVTFSNSENPDWNTGVFELREGSAYGGSANGIWLVQTSVIPEPGTFGLLGLSLAGLGWFSRRRRRSE